MINACYNYYISTKALLEKCDKEGAMAVNGTVNVSCLKRRL